jgi:urease accessory protein
MDGAAAAEARPGTGWAARLELAFAPRGAATALVHNRHAGPLRLIRALPLTDGRCQAVIVHPPGGLVGGDTLDLDVELAEGARVLVTTPGAQKWYRSVRDGAYARTCVRLRRGAALEWLPQPTLVFDAAQVDQSLELWLDGGARAIGWECLVLGRAAMGERFANGHLVQRLALHVAGAPAWVERTDAPAGGLLLRSPLGWGGRTVVCTVWAVTAGAAIADAVRDGWRAALDEAVVSADGRAARLAAGASRVREDLLAARLVADDSQLVTRVAQSLWAIARPALLGADSEPPRIWAT